MNNYNNLELECIDFESVSNDVKLLVRKLEYLPMKDMVEIVKVLDEELAKLFGEHNVMVQLAEKQMKTSFKNYIKKHKKT